MSKEPVLETERMFLREFDVEDAEFFYHLNLDEEVMRYTGDVAFDSIEHAREFVKAYDHYHHYGYGRWTMVLKDTGEPVGWCGLKYHPDEKYVDLGYRMASEFWGIGLATEAAMACVNYGFNKLGMKDIVGRTAQENARSVRVLEKVGMTFWKKAPCEGIEDSVFYRIEANG